MRRLSSLVLAITALACLPRAPLTGIEAVEISHDASAASATLAATEGLEDAGLDPNISWENILSYFLNQTSR